MESIKNRRTGVNPVLSSLVKGDGQPLTRCSRHYCASPFMGYSLRGLNLDHAAQLGHHVQALLLAQVLGTHDRLLIEQVTGTGLLLEVTLNHVYGPIHLLAGNLSNPLVGDGYG